MVGDRPKLTSCAVVLAALAVACAPIDRSYPTRLYEGSPENLDLLVAAGRECGYSDMEVSLRTPHLTPMVLVEMPRGPEPRFSCLMNWMQQHPKSGFLSQDEPDDWAAEDPRRPFGVAVAPPHAAAVEAAARECGLHDQRRLSRSGLAWIMMRDVLAIESDTNERVACLSRWAMAHPEIRVMFFGRFTDGTVRE